jgi:hypothetical protein
VRESREGRAKNKRINAIMGKITMRSGRLRRGDGEPRRGMEGEIVVLRPEGWWVACVYISFSLEYGIGFA